MASHVKHPRAKPYLRKRQAPFGILAVIMAALAVLLAAGLPLVLELGLTHRLAPPDLGPLVLLRRALEVRSSIFHMSAFI